MPTFPKAKNEIWRDTEKHFRSSKINDKRHCLPRYIVFASDNKSSTSNGSLTARKHAVINFWDNVNIYSIVTSAVGETQKYKLVRQILGKTLRERESYVLVSKSRVTKKGGGAGAGWLRGARGQRGERHRIVVWRASVKLVVCKTIRESNAALYLVSTFLLPLASLSS